MSFTQAFGHFAVIGSSCEWKKAPKRVGRKYMALVEIDPALPLPSRIDPRLKSIKRIILVSEPIASWSNKGYFIWNREWRRYADMAERWDKLYPLHIVAKDWPLPLPVYVE